MKILNTPLNLDEILRDLSTRTNRKVDCIRHPVCNADPKDPRRIFVFEAKEYDKPWIKSDDIVYALKEYQLIAESSYPYSLKGVDFRHNTVARTGSKPKVWIVSDPFASPEVYHSAPFLSEPVTGETRRYIFPPGWYPKNTEVIKSFACINNYPYPSVEIFDPSECIICRGSRGCHTFFDTGGPYRYGTRVCSECTSVTLHAWSQLVSRVAAP